MKQKTQVVEDKTHNVKYYVYIIENNIKRRYYTKAEAATIVQGNTRESFEEQKHNKLTMHNRMNYTRNITGKVDQKPNI